MSQRKTLPGLGYSKGVGDYLPPPPTSAPKYCSKKHPCTALQSKNPTIVHPHSDVRKLLTREICPFLTSYRLLLLTVYFSEPALGKDHKSILTPLRWTPSPTWAGPVLTHQGTQEGHWRQGRLGHRPRYTGSQDLDLDV